MLYFGLRAKTPGAEPLMNTRRRRGRKSKTCVGMLCSCLDPIWANEFTRLDCNIKWTSNLVVSISLTTVIAIILVLSATYLQVNDLNEVRTEEGLMC